MTEKMLMKKEGPAGFIIFNQPEKRNAVSQAMWQAIPAILDDLESDPNIRVIVVTGAGDKAFVSGADISEFAEKRNSAESSRIYAQISEVGRKRLMYAKKPTVAMIRGFCIGGGMAVAMSCDLRIASTNSRFGIPAARLGIAYSGFSVRALVSLCGPSIAKEILYTAKHYSPEEMYRVGFLNQVVPDTELESTIAAFCANLGENAPLSLGATKAIIDDMIREESERDPMIQERWSDLCAGSKDYTEGRTAFMEKRKPVFTGR